MTDYARQLLYKSHKSRCTIHRCFEIHRSSPLSVNLANYLILGEFDRDFLTQYD